MATYYHCTSESCAESIIENGFWLTSNDESEFHRAIKEPCVYFMDNVEDAVYFGHDNHSDGYAILQVELFDVAGEDPEYDGCAVYITDLDMIGNCFYHN